MNMHRPPKESVVFPAPPTQAPQDTPPAFSPLLASLLSMALKTGDLQHVPFSLLRDLYPYVCKKDQQSIASLFGYKQMAGEIASIPVGPPLHEYKHSLTGTQKMLGLLQVLKKFGGSPEIYDLAETFVSMNGQPELSNLLSLFGKLGGNPAMTSQMQQMMQMAQMMQHIQ